MSLPMSPTSQTRTPDANASSRLPGKPRIAVMGEFSAGKSTLANMLIGRIALPTKVTATQLPPVWISQGDDTPFARSLEGEDRPIDLDEIDQVSPHDTEYIRVFRQADTLDLFDLIDMPGISDPNIPPEVWERVMEHADAVLWCTHATQAWRQSEAAVWESYSDALAEKSLLLVTRFDKILGDSDRRRVLQRMQAEAGDVFRAILPVSLTQALAAEDDPELWASSGGADLASALIALSKELSAELTPEINAPTDPKVVQFKPKEPRVPQAGDLGVMPRRVQPAAPEGTRTQRPPRKDSALPPV